ncbi:MAG: type IV toxin-antitoxin system AbiEi family antitoxin domain-containing protein [Longimicrobiales bacterium]
MPGRVYNELLDFAAGQYGYVTTADARALGIDPDRLRTMARRGTIEPIAHGLYRIPAVPATGLDQYMEATLWPHGGGVLSHDTALDLHDLCDVNPAKVHVTVPARLRINREIPAAFRLHFRDLTDDDVTRHEGIPVVMPLRAIQDGIEAHLGNHLIEQAIESARRRGLIGRHDMRGLRQRTRGAASAGAHA